MAGESEWVDPAATVSLRSVYLRDQDFFPIVTINSKKSDGGSSCDFLIDYTIGLVCCNFLYSHGFLQKSAILNSTIIHNLKTHTLKGLTKSFLAHVLNQLRCVLWEFSRKYCSVCVMWSFQPVCCADTLANFTGTSRGLSGYR